MSKTDIQPMMNSVSSHALLYGFFGLVLYFIYGVIYRLYLSPLAKIPGPRLAALTSWYICYYDVIKGGKFVFKIKDLHEEYGI